jgi:hypothetical protein
MLGGGERLVSLRIDLNMVRGDRVTTGLDFFVDPLSFLLLPELELEPGDFVRVVEEEGDAYLAVVQEVDRDRLLIDLRILLDTWQPFIDLGSMPQPVEGDSEWTYTGTFEAIAA